MPLISDSIQWKRLEEHVDLIKTTHLKQLMQDTDRVFSLICESNDIVLDYSRQNMLPETMDMLLDLANAAGLEEKRNSMCTGVHINETEDRAVMHVALRAPKDKLQFIVDGEDVVPAVHEVLEKVQKFTDKVRNGSWKGATGKHLTSVLAIGIGGSFLGPEFVFEALRIDEIASRAAAGRTLRFLANVDPVDVSRALQGLNPENTLVIVVSKTFTTAETMLNAKTIKEWLLKSSCFSGVTSDVVTRQHMIAVSTAIPKAVDFGIAAENVFGFWDWVGGRFSVSSAVGVVPLSIQYGFSVVQSFLDGMHDMDTHFFEAPLRANIPVLLGLIGVWNSSFLGHSSKAILPYAQALVRFAAHIQQVDMESNGKRVSMDGTVLPYSCGEIVFGEPGTNGQHSFYQLVHQGRIVPAEFIGFSKSPNPITVPGEVVSNHDELMSNFFAQPDALAYGKTIHELIAEGVPAKLHAHKEFPGNRPSLSLLFPALNAFTCGQLLSMYEHRVAVQGFIWGINSFDQWGVELGKVLAGKIRTQLQASRADATAPLQGFNPSTAYMLKKYLS